MPRRVNIMMDDDAWRVIGKLPRGARFPSSGIHEVGNTFYDASYHAAALFCNGVFVTADPGWFRCGGALADAAVPGTG